MRWSTPPPGATNGSVTFSASISAATSLAVTGSSSCLNPVMTVPYPAERRGIDMYLGGTHNYRTACDAVAANGYEGFAVARSANPP